MHFGFNGIVIRSRNLSGYYFRNNGCQYDADCAKK